jgi:hypothetical protein
MTPEDLQQIAAIMGTTITAAEDRLNANVTKAKDETVEAMRDMQTEILKGLEGFARGNFARMHSLEAGDAATTA